MRVAVKICGLTDAASVAAAVGGGARLVGFVFFPPSPRALSPAAARNLAAAVPAEVARVGVVVDADDDQLETLLSVVPLEYLQCHGGETPGRLAEIRARFRIPVIKAIAVAGREDVAAAERYEAAADMLLFDARAPAGSNRPGGNACRFDWALLRRPWRRPWLLAGGLTAETVASAVAVSGAAALDVSSGVEDAPGRKSVARIEAFLAAARML
jgi:phosphoribosylanthranilate isomerase